MEQGEFQHDISAERQPRERSAQIECLRPVVVRKVNSLQVSRRRPIVRNKDGVIIWQADEDKYYYRDEDSGKHFSCSCSIEGGVVVVRDHQGEMVEGYKLRDGETVETV